MVYRTNFRHGPSGGHGLPKVSLGPAMPYPLCPAGVSSQGGRSAAVFYPLGYPTPYASDFIGVTRKVLNVECWAEAPWDEIRKNKFESLGF